MEDQRLFLLDAFALIYRAYYAFIKNPIKNSKGIIYVTQIAGLIARRIMCYVKENDSVEQGEQYGIIKFGSRVDISYPDSYVTSVSVGQRCVGGETIMAYDAKTLNHKRSYKKI